MIYYDSYKAALLSYLWMIDDQPTIVLTDWGNISLLIQRTSFRALHFTILDEATEKLTSLGWQFDSSKEAAEGGMEGGRSEF